MKKLFCAVMMLIFAAATAFGANDDVSLFKQVDHIETLVYGQPRVGGLVARLNSVEKDLFGRELPGSLAERQAALLNFIESGVDNQPSLLFKVGVVEWALESVANASDSLSQRISAVEERVEGSAMSDRPLAMRLERALSMVVSDPVVWETVTVPAGTVVRFKLLDELNPAKTKKGDSFSAELTHDLVMGERSLVAVRGSRSAGIVESVKKPRSFGRSSEIKFTVQELKVLAPGGIALTRGKKADEAAQIEASHAAAAGTSLVGAIVLGPVGLVGGFLVRGDSKIIPAGSVFYAETSADSSLWAYTVPDSLKSLVKPELIEMPAPAGAQPDKKKPEEKAPANNSRKDELGSL